MRGVLRSVGFGYGRRHELGDSMPAGGYFERPGRRGGVFYLPGEESGDNERTDRSGGCACKPGKSIAPVQHAGFPCHGCSPAVCAGARPAGEARALRWCKIGRAIFSVKL